MTHKIEIHGKTDTWHHLGTTTNTDWTRALSTADLYVITSNTTDNQTWHEAMAEIERRDDDEQIIFTSAGSIRSGRVQS